MKENQTTAIAVNNDPKELSQEVLTKLVLKGDLSGLSEREKVEYYVQFCKRLGLDPATQPFKLLSLGGKITLYAGRECCQQLNMLHKVSHKITSREKIDDLYIVTAQASQEGRVTESTGAVCLTGLKGDGLANAVMKCETKAKRRATLDLLGLGLLDESEVETIRGAKSIEYGVDGVLKSEKVIGGSAVMDAPKLESTPSTPVVSPPEKAGNIDQDRLSELKLLTDFMDSCKMQPDWLLNIIRTAKLIDDSVKNMLEIPVPILKKLNQKAWAQKLHDMWLVDGKQGEEHTWTGDPAPKKSLFAEMAEKAAQDAERFVRFPIQPNPFIDEALDMTTIILPVTTNKGKALSELSDAQLGWYVRDFKIREYKGKYSDKDLRLDAALCQLSVSKYFKREEKA
jgi:hypothetical protein